MNYPYNDDSMIFDETSGRYVLTEKALLDMGVDLRARLAARKATSPEAEISNKLKAVSRRVYGFIHEFSIYNDRQDKLLAVLPSARPVIFEALQVQADYELSVGNQYKSLDDTKVKYAISPELVQILDCTLPEIGRSILYAGV